MRGGTPAPDSCCWQSAELCSLLGGLVGHRRQHPQLLRGRGGIVGASPRSCVAATMLVVVVATNRLKRRSRTGDRASQAPSRQLIFCSSTGVIKKHLAACSTKSTVSFTNGAQKRRPPPEPKALSAHKKPLPSWCGASTGNANVCFLSDSVSSVYDSQPPTPGDSIPPPAAVTKKYYATRHAPKACDTALQGRPLPSSDDFSSQGDAEQEPGCQQEQPARHRQRAAQLLLLVAHCRGQQDDQGAAACR